MPAHEIKDEASRFEEHNPPLDLAREEAAFERERARLVRDHLGQIAVIHGDDIVGVYPTLYDAELDAYHRLGNVRLIFRPITAKDEPEFIPYMDINHPCVQRLDELSP
jgi:hypothetical protein